jgi:hypothetical protein
VFLVRLTESERTAIKADSEEYDEMAWMAPEAVAGGGDYHPALRRCVCSCGRWRQSEGDLQ